MPLSVFSRTLRDQSRALLVWSASAALLVAMYVAIWPSLRDQPSMTAFLERMPEAFRSLFAASGADMSTPVGYIQIELMSFVGPLIVIGYGVATAVAAVSGEEDRHTLDLLLAAPVSRTRVVLEKFAEMVVGTFLIAAVLGLALVLEGALADMGLPVGNTAAAMLHLALLGLVFGTLALALSATTGRSVLSRAVPVVVAVAAYVVNGLAPMADWLKPFQKLSPFYSYIGHDPMRHGVSVAGVLVALGTIAVLVVVAVLGFRRRDVVG
jgi:ABC-2 type transport system permease protein